MSEPKTYPLMKDILGPEAVAIIADAGEAAASVFDRAAFVDTALAGLEPLSIMERVRHIADALHTALPTDYATALGIVHAIAPRLTHSFQAIAVTEFVARHGRQDFERSMAALANLTRFGSAEFAIRPFLAADPERTLARMLCWTTHDDAHVRRLASEGSRPRLPWGSRVPALKADPTLAAPILDALRDDPSPYVRKSVANHLNDIGKDRPDWLLDHLQQWDGGAPRTAWIIRHALRTLIKKGDPRALAMIGAGHGANARVERFAVTPPVVSLGEAIAITVDLTSLAEASQRLVVDYRLHYARAEGKTAAKVFKLKTFDLAGSATATLRIGQTIRDFSTRRHHPGRHELELLVNGRVMATAAFNLILPEA